MLTLVVVLALVFGLGALADVMLRRHSPELYGAVPLDALQSSSFVPPLPTGWELVVADDMPSPLPPSWRLWLGLDDDDDDDSDVREYGWDDDEAAREAALDAAAAQQYRLSVFQPVPLLQVMQGLGQRAWEHLVRAPSALPARGALSPLALRLATSERIAVGDVGATVHPRVPPPQPWVRRASLGVAVMAMGVHFHTLILVASVSAFQHGSMLRLASVMPDADAQHALVLWQGRAAMGVVLLLFLLWGLVRVASQTWLTLGGLVQWALVRTPHAICDYDERTRLAPAAARAPRRSWAAWLAERVERGHAARALDDPRWLWMLAHAGD